MLSYLVFLSVSAGDATPLHQPHLVTLQAVNPTAGPIPSNPFLREVNVSFTHPASGLGRVVGAFYDGDGLWRARFTCSRPGRWVWASSDAGGDKGLVQTGELDCVSDPNVTSHGALEVNRDLAPNSTVPATGSLYHLLSSHVTILSPDRLPTEDLLSCDFTDAGDGCRVKWGGGE
jgi:hypothetical protein